MASVPAMAGAGGDANQIKRHVSWGEERGLDLAPAKFCEPGWRKAVRSPRGRFQTEARRTFLPVSSRSKSRSKFPAKAAASPLCRIVHSDCSRSDYQSRISQFLPPATL